jgi:pyruvate/2-oxoglutarate dehydrogenase complex dihydrolipoamide dehydrogenase (E3) component
VTFTDPEVAHVGAGESQARATHGDGIHVHRWEMGKVDRAICEDDQSGFLKIITKPDGTIVGATLVAARAGEAIVELIVALKQGMKVGDLSGTIHPYPTYSTAVQQMAADITLGHVLSGTSGKLIRGLSRAIR